MQLRRWSTIVLAAALGLSGVAMLLSQPVSAQAPDSRPTTSSQQTANTLNADAPLVFPNSASSVVLYDQLNNAGTTDVTSQNFETSFDTYDDFAADDFVVSGAQSWNIDLVEVAGEYGGGPATSVNVFFYSNAITLPGTLLAARTNLSYTTVLTPGNFAIPLSPTVRLNPGTYWISVQVNQDFTPNGQWYWRNRTVKTNSAAAWENPGNGFGTGCTSWGTRSTTCALSPTEPDQVFRLSGTLLSCPVDPIFNGSFETGSFAPWVIDGTANTPVVTTTQPHIGINSALLGTLSGAEPLGNSSFYQQIAVPPAGGLLSFWYWPFTTDSISFDWQDAYVTDSSGTILATIFHQAISTTTWTHQTFDMTPYAGQTVRIKFLVHEDGFGDDTAMYVDDVSLILPCATFSAPTYSVNENVGSATITVTLEAASPFTATVNFATSDGTATAGSDYITSSGTLTFTPGVTSRTFTVPIIDDALFEENETVNLSLSGATGAALGVPNYAVLTIIDNDPPQPLVCGSGGPGPWVLRNFAPIPVYAPSVANDGASAYVVGGYSIQTSGDVTQTVRYDLVANSWTPLAPVPAPVSMASAVYSPINNKLYVFGGEMIGTSQIFTTTRIYDVGSNSWSTGAPLPDLRAFMGGGYYNGKIYLVGGYSTGSVTPAYSQTWEYDVLANTWLTKTAMPQALGGPASAVVNGHLYIIGGRDISTVAMTQTYDYDIAGDTWFTRTNIPTGVNVPGTAALGGKVWVIGGGSPFLALDNRSQPSSVNALETFSTTQIYDPVGNSWSAGPGLNVQRSFVGATGFGNFAIAIGGYNGATTTGATEVTWNCSSVQFSAPTYFVNENGGLATITVTLSAASPFTATVNFATNDGTATAGSDYITSSGTLTFTPGVTSRTFTVPIIDDALFEENETVNLSLSGATNATLGVPNHAVLTIIDNDPPPPLVCGSGGPGPWVLRNFLPTPVYGLSVGNDGTRAFVVGGYSFQTGGDVTQTVRYDLIANSWTPLAPVPAPVSMASAVYAPINNKLYVFGGELAATSQVFSTTRIYDVGSNSWSMGAPMPDLRAFTGGGYYNGKIYIVGGYSTGSVTPAYSQTWEYDVLANTWVTKTAMPQALGGPASAVVNGHLYVIGGRDISTSAITQTYDYDIASNTWFTRTAIPTGVNVPGTAVLGGKVWVIGGGSPFMALGNQLQPSSINAPETFSTTQIYDPIGNSWSAGPNLNVQRSFVGATGFGNFAIAIGGYNGSTTTGATEVTQNCPRVQLSAPGYSVNENAGSATITVTLDSISAVTATVNFAASNGTALAGSDYTATSGTLTFAPGQMSRTFSVPILDDTLVEPAEFFTVTLSSPSNATLSAPNSASVAITDNDIYPTVRFSASGYFVNESAGTATITVTLSASYPLTATVSYATSNGTATVGSDYTASSGTLTFAPGQTSRTFTVPIINDILKEPNETVNLTLSNAINAILGLPNPATLTIVDNDYATYLPTVLKN